MASIDEFCAIPLGKRFGYVSMYISAYYLAFLICQDLQHFCAEHLFPMKHTQRFMKIAWKEKCFWYIARDTQMNNFS